MFRNLNRILAAPAQVQIFNFHPLQLSRWLDEAWAVQTVAALGILPAGSPAFLGNNAIVNALDLPLPSPIPSGINRAFPGAFVPPGAAVAVRRAASALRLISDHLIYAYLIESTGVFEVLAEIVRRFVIGETLNAPNPAVAQWLRTTEELFFRDPPLYSIQGVTSELRQDQRVNRRNAYWRMFGLEPPHAIPPRWAPSGLPAESFKLDIGDAVNTGFRAKWTELLRQVWLGIENANNGIGPNSTDREHISLLCDSLRDMMALRRRGGMLAREEFTYVSTLSWFHLAVEFDTPLVTFLNADGPGPAERLERLAARVGMTPAPRARELFELADLMSGLLRAIEFNLFGSGPQAELLYLNFGTNQVLLRDMNRIIDLWQTATGDRVKERPPGSTVQPLRLPAPTAPQAVAVQPVPASVGALVPNGTAR